MKKEEAKKANRWMTLIHRVVTILLAIITGTGIVRNEKTGQAIDFIKESAVLTIPEID